jgi:hypothetical protein
LFKYVFALLLFTAAQIPVNSGELKFVVKPYIQNVAKDGITILWETNLPSKGLVKYGEAKLNSNSPLLENEKISESKTKILSVRLNELSSEKKYFYRVITFVDSDTLIFEINSFMTSISSERPVTFAVFGDSQQQTDSTVWKRVSKLALLERPNFGLIVGDLVEAGSNLNHWRYQFLSDGHEFMKSIPLFPVLGNHDVEVNGEAKNYHTYMKHPGTKNYYTFIYGNIQFFILDSNNDMEPGSPQYEWLVDELAKSKSLWKIAAHHHPPYSSDFDDYGNTVTSLPLEGDPNFDPIIPLYEKYGVDLVFYGHIHSYERTWPLLNKKVDEDGVVYVQCGGAGGNNEISGTIRSWFTAKVKSDHFFSLISVNGPKLFLSAIDDEGTLFDYYEIDRTEYRSNPVTKDMNLSAPVFKFPSNKFMDNIKLTIINYNEAGEIRFTTDGSEPNIESTLYKNAIDINSTITVKAAVFNNGDVSKSTAKSFIKTEGKEGVKIFLNSAGLKYNYYTGENWSFLPNFNELNSKKSGIIENVKIGEIKDQEDQFAITYSGYIKIEESGVYDFYVLSDDGLFIDDELVVDNNGSHSPRTRSGNVGLKKGFHKFYLEYFEDCEGEELKLYYKSENFPKQLVPQNVFFH